MFHHKKQKTFTCTNDALNYKKRSYSVLRSGAPQVKIVFDQV